MPKMSRIKYLKGPCSQCGSNVEFPAEMVGTVADCPHCGKPTELLLAVPHQEPALPTRVIVWTVVAVLILALGLVGAMVALRRAEHLAAGHKQDPPATPLPVVTNETAAAPPSVATNAAPAPAPEQVPPFEVSEVALEKAPGGSLIQAVGTVLNPLDKQRFGVKVEIDLLNAAGKKIGKASDYVQVIEPKAAWHFKALVMAAKPASAKLASIKEDQ
jgi:hypothetical protein